MVRTAQEAVTAAKVTQTNVPAMCQRVVRNWLGVGSVGDQDGDGDADAVDGWLSEPESARYTDISKAPAGAPAAWSGGTGGFGHRALSLGDGFYRSTDANGKGRVGTRRWDWFEKNWNLKPLGWSSTISGIPIPGLDIPKPPPPPKPKPKPKTRGAAVDRSLAELKKAKKGTGVRAKQIKAALAALEKVPFLK